MLKTRTWIPQAKHEIPSAATRPIFFERRKSDNMMRAYPTSIHQYVSPYGQSLRTVPPLFSIASRFSQSKLITRRDRRSFQEL